MSTPKFAPSSVNTVSGLQQMLREAVETHNQIIRTQIAAVQEARKTAVPTVASQPPEIEKKLFAQHMQAMQEHYATGPGEKGGIVYTLPEVLVRQVSAAVFTPNSHPVAPPPRTPPKPAPPSPIGANEVDKVIAQIHLETQTVVQHHAESLASASEEAVRAKTSTAQWTQQMNSLRERDKQSARALLDKWYTQLADTGNKHPDQRSRILQSANRGGSFLALLSGQIEQVSHDVEKGLVGALHSAAASAQSAVQTVAHWASGATHSVAKFFGSLL